MGNISNDAEHAMKDEQIRQLGFCIAQWKAKVGFLEKELKELRDGEGVLRDEFAKAALIGLIASIVQVSGTEGENQQRRREVTASAAYDYADKMLKARE